MPAEVKVTTLCENSVPYPNNGTMGEHGLAMLLETGSKRILFDTGGGLTLLHNTRVLGLDFKTIDALVLSHGHYDHTGGLKVLLQERGGDLDVYAHSDIFKEKYSLQKGKELKKTGIPWTKEELEYLGARFHLTRKSREICKGVMLTGEIPRREKAEENTIKTMFCQKADGSLELDPLYDDQAIIVESSEGIIVLLGCAHSGLINTLRYVTELTGEGKIYACIGGTHLVAASAERLDYTVQELEKIDVQKIAPCHCTGFRAAFVLYQAFKDRFVNNSAGNIFNFG